MLLENLAGGLDVGRLELLEVEEREVELKKGVKRGSRLARLFKGKKRYQPLVVFISLRVG